MQVKKQKRGKKSGNLQSHAHPVFHKEMNTLLHHLVAGEPDGEDKIRQSEGMRGPGRVHRG